MHTTRTDGPLFAALALSLGATLWYSTGASAEADLALMRAFGGTRGDTIDTTVELITHLGSVWFALAAGLAGVLWLALRKERRAALHFGGVLVLNGALILGLKAAFSRPRPEVFDWLTHASGWAFPSGHSANAALLFPLLFSVFTARARLSRATHRALGLVAAALVLLVGLSRNYLGVHWPTDVLAGWGLGLLLWRLALRFAPPPEAPASHT